jgi:amino acid adenylation domain-containing protein
VSLEPTPGARSLDEKRALLARMLEKRAARPRTFPLSFAQQRLWFLDRIQPGNPAYNISTLAAVPASLDPRLLEAAFEVVVRRHPALRTTFALVEGQPVQVVSPEPRFHLSVIDLSDLEDEVRRREMWSITAVFLGLTFDLERGPLLYATYLRLRHGAEGHASLGLCMHHIISDGWSLGVLLREVEVVYGALLAGRPAPLPELPIQYADYAQWQREQLQGTTWDRLLGYWRPTLAGVPTVLDLPADRPRPPVQTSRGAGQPFGAPALLAERLYGLARTAGATPFMLLLAAFQACLGRHARQEDFCVGVPVAGRDRRELEGLIGFFANTLVLRARLAGNPSFRELLARTREAALGAFAHQDMPFEKLVEVLQPERDTSRTPLFQVSFVLQNVPTLSREQRFLAVGTHIVNRPTAKFDLTLDVAETENGLEGVLEYNRDLFDAVTVTRFGEHLDRMLEGIAAAPDTPLADLPWLSEAERHHLLREEAVASASSEATLHGLFASEARERPDAPALTCGAETLTYGELRARAARLARFLRGLEVGPEDRVALCLERSADLVVAILGVLGAGAAYLPIDPAYPEDRKAFLLEDSGAAVLVAHGETLGGQRPAGLRTVLLKDPATAAAIAAEPSEPLADAGGAGPDNLAYVIYTSGSTGRPKGVLIPHRNAVRLFTATAPWFGFGPRDVWTLFHSSAFDFSVWEIWGALLHGGRLVVVPYETSRSPAAFRELLAREGVTVLSQTPSAFLQLVRLEAERAEPAAPLSLEWVIFGGEALEPARLAPWVERHGGRPRLVNMYGITETTVHVTWRPIEAADLAGPQRSPIGGAIPDLTLRLLEPFERGLGPVPAGVSGEIHVGGAGLARGYLGRSALTAERFVPDPFGTVPGARLYRSGDLARRRGGETEYLGRVDHQVKIRGFRIELGEIESEIGRHPQVRQTVVRVEGEGERRRLVAYVVPAGGARPEPADLRGQLARRLPEYMIPAAWVLVPSLPLTANGKIDHKALQSLGQAAQAVAAGAYQAPQSALEQVVAEVWQGVLGVPRVGVRDNFFDLGGHSLLLVQVQSRLEERLGREVSMTDLLSNASVEALARFLAGGGDAAEGPGESRTVSAGVAGAAGAAEPKARLLHLRRAGRSNSPEELEPS